MSSDDPISAIMIGASVAGTGMSAYGSYQSGLEEKKAYDYNAAVGWRNTQAEEQKSKDEAMIIEGQARSLYGKSGVDSSSGSPLLHLKWLRKQGELESQGIRTAGQSQYQMMKMYGKNAKKAGTIGAISGLFSGLGQTGAQAYGSGMIPKRTTSVGAS